MHARNLREKLADLNLAIGPDLIILDGRRAFISGGPSKGELREPGLVWASSDRIALDVEGLKRCHQVLGQFEHAQRGISHTRIGLIDNVMHHMRFQALTARMNVDEKATLKKVLRQLDAEDLADMRLRRDIERKDYAWVLV